MKLTITKFFLSALVLLMFTGIAAKAQTYLYFQDSPDPDLYDYSWMELTPPSELERTGNELRRFPVESITPAQQGLNSLRLKWTSKDGGGWFAIAAGMNWTDKNISDTDTLSLYLHSVEGIAPENLPKIFFEDTQNNKSIFISLTDYSATLPAGQWVKLKVPMEPFLSQPNPIDYAHIKTLGFTQNVADNTEHTLFVDDVRVFKGSGTSPQVSVPQGLTATGYDSHVFLTWLQNPEIYVGGYEIFQSANGGQSFAKIGVVGSNDTIFTDFVGDQGANLALQYKINALNIANEPSGFSEIVNVSTFDMNDEQLLDMVQEATFRYFWDHAHPTSGMARERYGSGNTVTSGGSGFGVMAILVGIERGFITRQQGVDRMLKILNFLENADRFHGAWSHWINGETGTVIPFSTKDNGGDLVETAFLVQGLLAARQYFQEQNTQEQTIVQKITQLWESVEWDWYRRNNGNFLYWHWSPNYGWDMNMQVKGPNEAAVIYLLAIASPTHGVPASLWHDGWASSPYYVNGGTFYGYPLWVGWDYGGPLFFAHYSYLGFDPRNIKDEYANYFNNNRNHTLINRAYCIDNPKNYTGYSENCWGLTASDDPYGYSAHEPTSQRDNGTITPTAALSSMPYTPQESMDALKHFYRILGNKIWGNYGFVDAFNEEVNWFATSYLAIDQGPIIDMIENYRSGLLWNKFMANPEIQPALTDIGFQADPNSIGEVGTGEDNLVTTYPNPCNNALFVNVKPHSSKQLTTEILNVFGQKIMSETLTNHSCGSEITFRINTSDLSKGMYFIRINLGDATVARKFVIE